MQDVRSLIHQAHTENWEELDLSGMNLTELPPEIVCLTELRSLILGKEEVGEWKDGEYVPTTIANQLTTLPQELGALVNLREIDLSGNPIVHFPPVLLKLERLEMLNLANVGLPIVPDTISQLTHLKRLYLHSNQFTEIPDSISQLINLRELSLHNNELSEISDSIGQLINLRVFSVSGSQSLFPTFINFKDFSSCL